MVFCINRTAIDCYDFVGIFFKFLESNWIKINLIIWIWDISIKTKRQYNLRPLVSFFLINVYFFIFQFCALIIGFVTTGLTISSLLLYVIPVAYYKVFYALWVCLFYVFFSGIYSIMAPVIQTTFGQLNYSRDYGLVFTQSVSTFESICR